VTERLYYTDAYRCEFEATVVEKAEGERRIYLDRTAFYPTSGGQPFDTGQLNGIEVTDVVDEGDRIAHVLGGALSEESVTGRIHWPRRFDHMQQHTGQHLLSAVVADLLGLATVSVHFGSASSTVDLEGGLLAPEQIAQVEDRANQLVADNRPVLVSLEEAATAIGLRKPPTRTGTIRIISIEGVDRSACGGTHVAATGEIGAILTGKVERVRKAVRLEFFCGARAIRRARGNQQLLSSLAAEYSASADELPDLIALQRSQLKEAVAGRRLIQEQFQQYRAKELYAAVAPDATGIRRTVVREAGGELNELRGVAQAYAAMPRAIFIGAVERPPSVLLAVSPDSGLDAGAVLKGLLGANGGRGGGSPTLAQGLLPGTAQLETVVSSLCGSRN
jgi:alanyl-tRNA synthetase